MRDPRTPTWAPGASLVLAVVALALLGLLSMHGWGSHTLGHTMEMAPASGAVTMQLDHAAHDRTAVTDGHPAQADGVGSRLAPSTAEHGSPGSGHGAGLLGLCLAVLAALLLGTGLLSARRRVRPPRPFLPTRPPSAATGRDRDPPDRLRLCVIRC